MPTHYGGKKKGMSAMTMPNKTKKKTTANPTQKRKEKMADAKKMDASMKGTEKMGAKSKEKKLTKAQKTLPEKLQKLIMKKKKGGKKK
tara:strand:+ start:4289 stop:4552 length:264 start_codon:yes stop_codon:yes gene_type:complete